MPATKLSDLLIPQNWSEYVIERTAEKSALWKSGIVLSDPRLDDAVRTGGQKYTMPFFQDLTGESEILSDTTPLSVDRITTANELAVVIQRGKAWGASQLGSALAGTDPLAAIAELVSDYWVRDLQRILVRCLAGSFGSASMATNVLDQSANPITPSILIDGMFRLGDAADKLSCLAVHSFTYKELLKQNLITFRKYSEQGEEMPTYLGKDVIVDDGIPITATTVDAYLFGPGAIAFGEASPDQEPVETDRDSLQGEDYLIMRRKFSIHPRGVSFIGTPAASSPTNAELALGTNWARVYQSKNVPLVRLVTKVA